MNEYNISDYKIFDAAISTTKSYGAKIEEAKTAVSEAKTTISNESVFMGPIQENCVQEMATLENDINTLGTNFTQISSLISTTNATYQSGDKEASQTVLKTGGATDTSKTYGISKDGGAYTAENSYTNTKSGATYKLYDQGVGEWANYQYSDGKNMSYRGCMLTAAASVSSSSNAGITPGNLFNDHRHDYVSSSVTAESNGTIKSQSLSINDNTNNEIISNLQKGNSAIIMVKGRNDGGSSNFTSSQHYMALLDISDDGSKIFVGNSHINDGGNYSSNGWYPTEEVLNSVREATVFTPAKV